MRARHEVLVIDDHALFRRGLAQLIAMDDEFTVVGEAASGAEGIDLALRMRPNVILIDLNMPDMNGIETIQALKARNVDSRFVVLTVSDDERDALSALCAGAHGYLLKEMEPEDLCASLKRVARGSCVLDEVVTTRMLQGVATQQRHQQASLADLTPRETRVLEFLADGLSNKTIARELGISVGTVKVHVKHVLAKLGLHSRLEAVVWRHEQLKSRHDAPPAGTPPH